MSSSRPYRSSPSGRQMPELPLSLASSVTSVAPASRSSVMAAIHSLGGCISDLPESLKPTSDTTSKSRASLRM